MMEKLGQESLSILAESVEEITLVSVVMEKEDSMTCVEFAMEILVALDAMEYLILVETGIHVVSVLEPIIARDVTMSRCLDFNMTVAEFAEDMMLALDVMTMNGLDINSMLVAFVGETTVLAKGVTEFQ